MHLKVNNMRFKLIDYFLFYAGAHKEVTMPTFGNFSCRDILSGFHNCKTKINS
jgi:hypothetical protein